MSENKRNDTLIVCRYFNFRTCWANYSLRNKYFHFFLCKQDTKETSNSEFQPILDADSRTPIRQSLWHNLNIAFKRECHCHQHAAALHSSGPLVTTLHKLAIVISLWILPWQSPITTTLFSWTHRKVQFVEQKTVFNNRAMQTGRGIDLPHWSQTSPWPSLSLPKSGIDWRSPLWETAENTDWHGAAVGRGAGGSRSVIVDQDSSS